MTTQEATLGYNRTGIATSKAAAQEMMEGTSEFPPSALGDESLIGEVRNEFARNAEPVGSVPPPMSVKGVVSTAIKGLKGERPTQFLDKLGERLAFERSGVRLYEALISKYVAFGGFAGGPELAELESNMQEEHEHFRLLVEVISKMGGDPTVMTPSADLQATMTKGVLEVMVDARTTFVQCLDALLLVELADNDCWEALVDMAEESGDEGVLRAFEKAREEEAEHLEEVRAWIATAQDRRVA